MKRVLIGLFLLGLAAGTQAQTKPASTKATEKKAQPAAGKALEEKKSCCVKKPARFGAVAKPAVKKDTKG